MTEREVDGGAEIGEGFGGQKVSGNGKRKTEGSALCRLHYDLGIII